MSDSLLPSPRADYRAGAEELGTPSVEVVRHTERIARVEVIGEHDLSTKDSMLDALATAASRPCVIVDLTRCTFVDSSFIGVLVALHDTDICSVRLVVPGTQRIVRRAFEIVQMEQFFVIHDSLDQALLAAAEDDSATPQGSSQEVAS
jgi:anti-anti-sigma factor